MCECLGVITFVLPVFTEDFSTKLMRGQFILRIALFDVTALLIQSDTMR
jgi:hypothetical protein